MNYVGVSFAALSAIFYLFVKSETNSTNSSASNETDESSSERAPLIDDITAINESRADATNNQNFIEGLNPKVKRIVGTSLAVFSGILYVF